MKNVIILLLLFGNSCSRYSSIFSWRYVACVLGQAKDKTYFYEDHIKNIYDDNASDAFKESSVFCMFIFMLIMSFVYFTIAACADRCTTDISCVAYHYDEETNDCLLIPKVQDLSHI